MKNLLKTSAVALLLLAATLTATRADEGMYPLSEIHKLKLKAKGLKIDPKELYNPNGVSLIDAIVMVGGCTGSFVSPDGLVLTNHHCAFGAVQGISTKENDYITHGYYAPTRADEKPARGYTIRITESYRDVSKDVLGTLKDDMDLAERSRTIEKKMRELVQEAEKQNPGKRAEVSEMFAGRSYVLFLYAFFRDVRLVYVPPRSIGEFGGENDNWVWPRHTGDFSFLRVYVAPDGSPADYSPDNVPYKPKRFLKVQPKGVDENDFVFILGYPGRTFRHRTSHYLQYEEEFRMPYVADLFDWQISVMEEMGKSDRGLAIKFDSRIKGFANTTKNYRGKLHGMRRLRLVDRKREEEQSLQYYIESDPQRKQKYATVLSEIGDVYAEMSKLTESELILNTFTMSSQLAGLSLSILTASVELQKPDSVRASAYTDKNYPRTKEGILRSLSDYYEPVERLFLRELLMRSTRLPAGQRLNALDSLLGSGPAESAVDRFLDRAYGSTSLSDTAKLSAILIDPVKSLVEKNEPFFDLARALDPAYKELRARQQRRDGALNRLFALLVDVKEQWQKTDFIPDANRTLRLTYGYIRGYSPADATYLSPITTLRGVIEKTTDAEPFNSPQKLMDLAKAKDYGQFKHAKLNDIPVALLYNLDTTGGNSGSPLINAYGEIVGVNFDRAWEATINDYAWSESYSRSIAVDIRYVLWVTQKIGGAEHLLKEMGVTK